MFRSLLRKILPNPLDAMLAKTKKNGGKHILLGWNRGLGDIALGLYAIVYRIREYIPDAKITFLIRKNLQEGFTMLEGINTIVAPHWKRGLPYDITKTLAELNISKDQYDLIIDYPNPTSWVSWQKGLIVPKLRWDGKYDALAKEFSLPKREKYIGVQIDAETHYGRWRNWPLEKWHKLFRYFLPNDEVSFLLFGFSADKEFSYPNVIDLRGKTNLFSLLALIKTTCTHLILPDSGILSMVYYLDVPFPIRVVSLWADPRHGILKQNVRSPNPMLQHRPVIGKKRDLSSVGLAELLPALESSM